MSPLRAWRSANSVGASSPMVFMSSGLVAPPPGVRDHARVGVDLADLRVPEPPELEEALLLPEDVRPPRRVLRVVRPGQLVAGRGPEVRPAVLAVAHPGAGPAVDEDAVDAVARHDLPVDRGHELEVVRPQGAGDPHLGRGPVPARLPCGVDGDPVGVGLAGRRRRSRAGRSARGRPCPASGSPRPARRTGRGRPGSGCGGGAGPRWGSRRRSRRRSGRRRRCGCGGSSRARTRRSNWPGSSSTSVSCAQRIGRSTQLGDDATGAATAPGTSPARATSAPPCCTFSGTPCGRSRLACSERLHQIGRVRCGGVT